MVVGCGAIELAIGGVAVGSAQPLAMMSANDMASGCQPPHLVALRRWSERIAGSFGGIAAGGPIS
jgi:hypothetical protein